jgi:hypothetical protein
MQKKIRIAKPSPLRSMQINCKLQRLMKALRYNVAVQISFATVHAKHFAKLILHKISAVKYRKRKA